MRFTPTKNETLPMALILLLGMILVLATRKATSQITKPGCLENCGSVRIPYPFGTSIKGGDHDQDVGRCYLDESFLVICNHSFNPPKLSFPNGTAAIINISLDGELRVENSISRACYDKFGNLTTNYNDIVIPDFSNPRFPVSATKNMFTAVGCNAVGSLASAIADFVDFTYCKSSCSEIEQVTNGSCHGLGCCQKSLQDNASYYVISVRRIQNNSQVYSFNPCVYSFISEAYHFSSLDLADFQNRDTVPLVLDWSVRNQTCQISKQNLTAYACRARYSECVDSRNVNGPGYRCKCSDGFAGNPYLLDGCQDVNECKSSKPCTNKATCKNLAGSFKCICPKGYTGDGKRNGTGCKPKNRWKLIAILISLGICLGLLMVLLGGSWIYWGLKKKKLIKLKQKFFQQNGGLLLQQQLSQYKGSVESAQVFTEEELIKATNNFDKSRVLGQGGFGTVYKGVLTDNKMVAIKKSKIGDRNQIEQFINEVIVLSQINHRNVVKLIGCCLETEVPLLVYEFITNGTLFDHIHSKAKYPSLSWEMRLKIAIEIASALAYLHSSASMPIIHRDVKTANILLNNNYTAKIADFGASRLVPLDQSRLTTLVQGTLGYLDPEYFHTSQLTEKSDVYSFGVVLAELLTGQKVLSLDRPECERNLAMYFVSAIKENRLIQILDKHMEAEEGTIQKLKMVANVTKDCLQVKGEERPSMKEVAAELEGLMGKEKHTWGQDHLVLEQTENLLHPSDPYCLVEDHGHAVNCTSARIKSMNIQLLLSYDDGR